MSCHRCGNTSSSPCACQDHGLNTPCHFTDCTPPLPGRSQHPEHCTEISCLDCIAQCRSTFQVANAADQWLIANQGDKLDTILQKMFIFATEPSCWNLAVPHLWHDEATVGQTTVTLKWDTVPATVTSINVQYTPVAGGGAWTTDATVGINTFQHTIGTTQALIPGTQYRFRLLSTDGASSCSSVELIIETAP